MSKKTLTFEAAFEQLCSESRSLGYRYMLRDLEPQFRRIWDAATATARFPPRAVGPADAETMSVEAAARLVGKITGRDPDNIVRDKESWTKAYREAASMMHPDGAHRDPAEWKLLQDAKTLLDGLHQGRK